MLDEHGFDLWANGYDDAVRQMEAEYAYPFAGYSKLMNTVYGTVMTAAPARVLDVGIGTAVLAKKLYEAGCEMTGIDFSPEMLLIARRKMPGATLLPWDINLGLPPALGQRTFDFILSTYAMHHLAEDAQEALIGAMLNRLSPQGRLLIGDVCFPTDEALLRCKEQSGDDWDGDERYIVVSGFQARRPEWVISFQTLSFCCGLLEIARRP